MSSWRRTAIATAALTVLAVLPLSIGTASAQAGKAHSGTAGTTSCDEGDQRGAARAGWRDLHAHVVGTLEDGYAASSLNRHGDVPFRTEKGEAMVWNANTGERRALEGAQGAVPFDIADDGRVVGAQGNTLVLWDTDGKVSRPDALAGEMSIHPAQMAEDGTVVLQGQHWIIPVGAGLDHPRLVTTFYRWQPGTGFERLTQPNDGWSAVGISHDGLIVGGTGSAAVAWHPQGNPEIYANFPGHSRSWAGAVNDEEVVVGAGQCRSGRNIPMRWDDPADPQELPDLGFGGIATHINNRGWIAGYASTTARGDQVPVVWDPHGGLHRLDELLTPERPAKGDTLSSIDAVNDRNQLLVWVQRADRTMFKEVVQLR